MAMTDDGHELDDLFRAARASAPQPSAELTARILADALREQPCPVAAPRQRRRWGGVLAALGGWQAVTGLTAAAAAGLWIGINPPAAVAGIAEGLWPEPLSLELIDQMAALEELVEG